MYIAIIVKTACTGDSGKKHSLNYILRMSTCILYKLIPEIVNPGDFAIKLLIAHSNFVFY